MVKSRHQPQEAKLKTPEEIRARVGEHIRVMTAYVAAVKNNRNVNQERKNQVVKDATSLMKMLKEIEEKPSSNQLSRYYKQLKSSSIALGLGIYYARHPEIQGLEVLQVQGTEVETNHLIEVRDILQKKLDEVETKLRDLFPRLMPQKASPFYVPFQKGQYLSQALADIDKMIKQKHNPNAFSEKLTYQDWVVKLKALKIGLDRLDPRPSKLLFWKTDKDPLSKFISKMNQIAKEKKPEELPQVKRSKM